MAGLPDWESLTLAQQVAQMVVVRASGYLFDHQIQYPAWEPRADVLKRWVQLGVGGVILLGGSAAEVGLRSQQLQDWATVPLLIAADIEEGVGQRFSGATWFPPPLALAAIAQRNLAEAIGYAQQMGSITAQEALAIGINWVLAPVVDVNNNPQNPVINVRAFGETAERVRDLSIAFLRGAQQHRVLTAAKHFPGHGDTATDSHLALPVLPHSRVRLAAVELPPFAAAIEAGVDAVMSAHLQIPALDKHPATLSDAILTTLLRQQMGFEGLIVTDALVMGAIADRYGANEAPLLALEAGADILLMPLDPEGAIDAICQAVESGRVSPQRIQASAERIWRAKHKVCAPPLAGSAAHEWEKVSPPIDLGQLARPEAIGVATQILQASQQIHSPSVKIAPNSSPLRNLILLDEALGCEFLGKHTPAIVLPQARGYSLQIVDSHTGFVPFGKIGQSSGDHRHSTLLQLFIRGNPFRGSAGLNQMAQDWVKFLLDTEQLQALVIYGSPYVLEQFLPLLVVPYVFTYGQMPAAQTIALSALFDTFSQ